ncbi:LuxR family transcriptional regulator [Thermoanaerobacterium thermosaccharolyticum]|uniref:LuxR family transcriptional regulator n=1 Tax=Thermoanaerobacterium thermosaccharolyticum TaxID=1517 RepID=A0A223HXE2_THETR|nr:AsnC family protein [Thermoanaerobacterium thermosaccharolyticum]AST56945.1 LuxR family transcriptional regulator [Thermoanaerobacterium thermosaccharolyticum]
MNNIYEELIMSIGESKLSGVDPNKNRFKKMLDEKELARRKENYKSIIYILDIIFNPKSAFANLLKQGYFFVLCDKDGYVIRLIYDQKLKDYFSRLHFVEGVSLRIEDCGTNAINIAMKLKRQVEICGTEHYCHLFKNWNCTAIPIVDYYGREIIAYLDMSVMNIDCLKEESVILWKIADYIEKCLWHMHEKDDYLSSKLDHLDRLILSVMACKYERKIVLKEIGISERTLRRHIEKLYELFAVNNDLGIVMKAINNRIIDTYGNLL